MSGGFLGDDDDYPCVVVANDLGQYSIWPEHRDAPEGWHRQEYSGRKADCLRHIGEVWADPTPFQREGA